MKVNGLMKKLTAMASTYTKMVPFIVDSGRMTLRKEGESSVFLMVRCSLETSYRVRKKVLACLSGRTGTDLKETFIRTAFRVMASTDGMMAVSMWACGKITRWKGRASRLGRMESATWVNTNRIRSMDKELSAGQLDTFTRVVGRMENKKEKETLRRMAKQERTCGGMVSVSKS